jgi:hypothetical protein
VSLSRTDFDQAVSEEKSACAARRLIAATQRQELFGPKNLVINGILSLLTTMIDDFDHIIEGAPIHDYRCLVV